MPARSKPLSPLFLQPGRARRHADFVLGALPEVFGGYHEPFLLGGAVAVAMMERFPQATFHLSSDDREVITTWQVLQTEVDRLVRLVAAHQDQHDRAHRSLVEAQGSADPGESSLESLSPVERAARLLYLRGSSPDRANLVFDAANVRGVAALLRRSDVRFEAANAYASVAAVRDEDLVYLDPPFAQAGVGDGLVKEARSLVNTLTARGAYLLAPEPTALPGLYRSWNAMQVVADRGDDDLLWANGTLARVARRAAEQARRER